MKIYMHPLMRKLVWLALALTLAGCGVLPAAAPPPAEPEATPDFDALRTEVARAVILNLTLEAAQAMQDTPTTQPTIIIVTATAEEESSLTATPFVLATALPTATTRPATSGSGSWRPTATSDYTDQAKLVAQSPKDYTWMDPNEPFDARWTFKNTGKRQWNNDFYIRHLSGFKAEKGNTFYFPSNPKVNETVEVVVDMRAPSQSGHHVTYWQLINDDGTPILRFYLVINVR